MKKKIAIIAGGNSSEVIVSLKSAQGIYSFIDKKTYEVYIVTLIEKKWSVKLEDETEVDIDNDFSFILNGEKILLILPISPYGNW